MEQNLRCEEAYACAVRQQVPSVRLVARCCPKAKLISAPCEVKMGRRYIRILNSIWHAVLGARPCRVGTNATDYIDALKKTLKEEASDECKSEALSSKCREMTQVDARGFS